MRPHHIIGSTLTLAVALLVWAVGHESAGAGAGARPSALADAPAGRRLAWIDRDGRVTEIPAPPRAYAYPRLSPDGRRLALDVRDDPDGLWIWDFARQTLSPVSVGRGSDISPVWAHSGDWLLFARGRGVAPGLWAFEPTYGSGGLTRLLRESNSLLMPTSLLPDDRHVLVTITAPTGFDILAIDLKGERTPTPLVATMADDLNAESSPDGRWIAYESRRSGQSEVWVRHAWDGVVDLRVTFDGGTRPAWTRNGRELVYLDAQGAMVARPIDLSTHAPTLGPPRRLFTVDRYQELVGRSFDVTADGQRFVVVLNRD